MCLRTLHAHEARNHNWSTRQSIWDPLSGSVWQKCYEMIVEMLYCQLYPHSLQMLGSWNSWNPHRDIWNVCSCLAQTASIVIFFPSWGMTERFGILKVLRLLRFVRLNWHGSYVQHRKIFIYEPLSFTLNRLFRDSSFFQTSTRFSTHRTLRGSGLAAWNWRTRTASTNAFVCGSVRASQHGPVTKLWGWAGCGLEVEVGCVLISFEL